MRKRDPLSFNWTVKPGNSAFVIPLDSTRGLINGANASIASGSTYLAPGPNRGRWAGAKIMWTANCTTQNVTLDEQIMTGTAGTSADWETQNGSSGTHTITAGTTAIGEFKPLAGDFRLLVTAGATGPGALTMKITVVWTEDFGN